MARPIPVAIFLEFAAERFTRSSSTQKLICRAFQELSIYAWNLNLCSEFEQWKVNYRHWGLHRCVAGGAETEGAGIGAEILTLNRRQTLHHRPDRSASVTFWNWRLEAGVALIGRAPAGRTSAPDGRRPSAGCSTCTATYTLVWTESRNRMYSRHSAKDNRINSIKDKSIILR